MPRVKTTPMVRVALWALRIYLIVLLALIGLKFLRVSSSSDKKPLPVAAPAAQPAAPKP